ncbi:MAG: rhomboid-like protein [Streptosporangiaceae bacterium]
MRRRGSEYAAATVFAVLFAIGGVVTAVLPARESAALRLWASTNVANLQHHPVPALVLSAFLPSGSPFTWLVPIALTMFGANRAAGTARLALICAAGHLIGTGVSEGIVAYRVDHGRLPPARSDIPDVGPSYVVVSAIVVAVMFGTWLTRVTALTVFAVLVFVSHIFAGLTSLHVAAVGHLTAIVTAAALCLWPAVGIAASARGTSANVAAGDAQAGPDDRPGVHADPLVPLRRNRGLVVGRPWRQASLSVWIARLPHTSTRRPGIRAMSGPAARGGSRSARPAASSRSGPSASAPTRT